MSKRKRKRPKPEQEAAAVRDVARVMLAWAARLGPMSPVSQHFEREAEASLAAWRDR